MNLRQKPLQRYSLDDLEYLMNNNTESVKESLDAVARNQVNSSHFGFLSIEYQWLAVLNYYFNRPFDEVRECFANAAQYRIRLLERILSGEERERDPWPSLEAERITCAMIAGRWDFATTIAETIKAIDVECKPVNRKSVFSRDGWMIIHLVQEEDEQAIGYAQTFLKHKNPSKNLQKFIPKARMTAALVERNSPALMAAMNDYFPIWERLARYGTDREDSTGLMCFPGMAYLALAKRRQIDLDADYPYLFRDLLEG